MPFWRRAAGRPSPSCSDARLAANEEALKTRTETEQLMAARPKEHAVIEQRLMTREELVNRQLENLVREEKVLRADKEQLAAKAGGN